MGLDINYLTKIMSSQTTKSKPCVAANNKYVRKQNFKGNYMCEAHFLSKLVSLQIKPKRIVIPARPNEETKCSLGCRQESSDFRL